MEAVRVPVLPGLNPTVIVQLLPAASDAGHVFVDEKSPAFEPVTPILVMSKGVAPVFVSCKDA